MNKEIKEYIDDKFSTLNFELMLYIDENDITRENIKAEINDRITRLENIT